MKKFVACLVFCGLIAAQSVANAGAIGSAFLSVSNLKLNITKQGNNVVPTRDATGTFKQSGATTADFRVEGSETKARNEASLDGPGGPFFDLKTATLTVAPAAPNVSPFYTITGSPDAAAAFAGPSLPAEPFTTADTAFGGAPLKIIDPLFPNSPTNSAAAISQAAFNVNTFGFTGAAEGKVTNTSDFKFRPSQTFEGFLSFNAQQLLSLTYDGTPSGLEGTVASSFAITLTKTTSGGGQATVLDLVVSGLNQSRVLSTVGASPISYNSAVALGTTSFTSGPTALVFNAGDSYTLTIKQSSSVILNTVPEPASLAVFGLLGLGAVVVGKRRKK